MHRRVFRCPVEFNCDFDGISCSSRSLDLSHSCGNPGLAVHAERFLDMLAAQHPRGSVTNRTRHAILLLLNHSQATMDNAADNLGLHSRSLQRMLEREGTSFAALLNETRREMALRYLITSDHSQAQISDLLGYSTQSSFTRWFVGEFGKPPAAWRSADRAEAALLAEPCWPAPLGMA
jgi:AraC-like DNA-binding protein